MQFCVPGATQRGRGHPGWGRALEPVMRCRPGTVPFRGGPGSAVHHERTPTQNATFEGLRALALHRIRDTRTRPLAAVHSAAVRAAASGS